MPIASVILLAAVTLPAFLLAPNTQAKSYSMTVTIDNSVIDMNVSPSKNGSFAKSSNSTVSVATDNASGYTLSIASSDRNDGRLVNSNDDGSNNDGTNGNNYLPSITEQDGITEEQYKTLPSDGSTSPYNNTWAYLPSMWDGQANTLFRPSPTKAGHVLDHTTTANPEANKYTLAIGARVDTTQRIGSYSNTYVVLATANGTPYTIAYKDDTITNFPTDESATAEGDKVAISNLTPVKDGYTFLGWCAGTTSTSKVVHNANGTDTCNGTSYTAGDTWTIDQTIENNNLVLYAMWGGNYTIDAFIAGGGTMQDFSTMTGEKKSKIIASMTTDQQYQLKDTRDNNVYWVSRLKDGKVWMTQGLDLDLKNGTVLEHTKSDIGWTESRPGKTWNPAVTANTISFEGASGTAVSGWTVNIDGPYSANPYGATAGDGVYIVPSGSNEVDAVYSSLSACASGADMTEAECSHHKVGNYYNFAAATATNSVAGTLGHDTTNADNYTVMPDSICPAGWRMPHGLLAEPTNGVDSMNNSEFDTLFYAYRVTANTGVASGTSAGYGDNMTAFGRKPLYFTMSGYISDAGLNGKTVYASSRTNTVYDGISAYNLDSYTYTNGYGLIFVSWPGSRGFGFQMRCILR